LRTQAVPSRTQDALYKNFESLDGSHPYRAKVPEGYILYPVEKIEGARILYFNFELAEEMGLVPTNGDHKLNRMLEKKILDTFALKIVNEFEQEKKRAQKIDLSVLPKYMATRYLQLQHQSKTGKTSGDGRSIWNGCVKNKDKIWDVSSRGTGVTRLAPGAVEAGKPLPTGCEKFGYGCGLAELDELVGSALMSEIFHRQGIKTERMLAIIQSGKETGIGVRAAPNLLRPAHILMYLKQNNLGALTRSLDYLIERQVQNGEWHINTKGKHKYELMLKCIENDFARFAARLDVDYIFLWLDWDGDNVLANGGIIDYGSVRQFGVRHDQYRFDDGPRYSTNLNEQKCKAQQIVQAFAQAVDFVKTGKKKPLATFKSHPHVLNFSEDFKYFRLERILYRLGFDLRQCRYLLSRHLKAAKDFVKRFQYFERKKTHKRIEKVADGLNRPAVFNMRTLFRLLPEVYFEIAEIDNLILKDNNVLTDSFSDFANTRDRKVSRPLLIRLAEMQISYKNLLSLAQGRRTLNRTLRDVCSRSRIINDENRITGNGVESVVQKIIDFFKKGMDPSNIQAAIEEFIRSQVLAPEAQKLNRPHDPLRGPSKRVFTSLVEALKTCKDDI